MGEEGLVFVDAEDVYAAFRVIRGGYDWENEIIKGSRKKSTGFQ